MHIKVMSQIRVMSQMRVIFQINHLDTVILRRAKRVSSMHILIVCIAKRGRQGIGQLKIQKINVFIVSCFQKLVHKKVQQEIL